jgi:hypothetical protein
MHITKGEPVMASVQLPRNVIIEETQVGRYHAFEETASGFTLPTPGNSEREFRFALPGAIALPAVIYYRTRHSGLPIFSVNLNEVTVTEYTFVDGDEAERTWHEIIPANKPGSGEPFLLADGNSLIFFASGGSVVFGDVVILYTSNQTTVPVPIPIVTAPVPVS